MDKYGRLIIDQDVRATMMPGGTVLKGEWNGTYAGVPQTRDELEAYALTHGYKFDSVVNRFYDVLAKPEVIDTDNNITQYARYDVYLPLSDAPEQTPEQAAGMQPPQLDRRRPRPAARPHRPSRYRRGAGRGGQHRKLTPRLVRTSKTPSACGRGFSFAAGAWTLRVVSARPQLLRPRCGTLQGRRALTIAQRLRNAPASTHVTGFP